MRTPILHKFSQKMLIFRGFSKIFFRTTGFQLKLMILIASPNIFHWKPAKKIKVGLVLRQNLGQIRPNVVKKVRKLVFINRFFSYFTWEYLLKQKAVVVYTLEWKFMANIARNTTFEGYLGPNFFLIWVKNGKENDSFQEFDFS